MMNLPLVTVIGLIVAVVGVLMTVIGFPTTSWETATFGPFTFTSGLFALCTSSYSVTNCVNVDSSNQFAKIPDWIIGTRAMVIIGFLLGVACVVALTVYIIKRDLKILHPLGMVFAFAAGFCVFIGIIIYAAKRTPTSNFAGREITADLGWSFVLTVIGGVAFVIAGVIILVDKLRGPAMTG